MPDEGLQRDPAQREAVGLSGHVGHGGGRCDLPVRRDGGTGCANSAPDHRGADRSRCRRADAAGGNQRAGNRGRGTDRHGRGGVGTARVPGTRRRAAARGPATEAVSGRPTLCRGNRDRTGGHAPAWHRGESRGDRTPRRKPRRQTLLRELQRRTSPRRLRIQTTPRKRPRRPALRKRRSPTAPRRRRRQPPWGRRPLPVRADSRFRWRPTSARGTRSRCATG